MRVADYVIDFIYKRGASHIFTLTGGGAMFLNDATVIHKKIKYVCHHHEQAAAMAAEAYAKTNNKIGVGIFTSGPGSTNAITGLLEAWQNSIPCIFLSSQSKKSQMCQFSGVDCLRQFGTQEVDIIPITKSITKYAATVVNPDDIRYQIEKAYFLAKNGRPGPVWLDIPQDVAGATINPSTLKEFKESKTRPSDLSKNIAKLISLLKKSKKPLIIAGGGIRLAGAVELVRKLVTTLKIPVVSTNMGFDIFEFDCEYYVGHGGTKGQRAANIAMQNADLIISLGSRLAVPFIGHEYDKFAPHSKKVVVDIDREEHRKKTINIDLFINADIKSFIEQLSQKITGIKFEFGSNWLKNVAKLKYGYPVLIKDYKKNKNSINMYHLVDEISKYSGKNDIFVTDAGTTAYATLQALKLKKNQRAIIPGCTLTMGYNLPAVIGISKASPESRIICITGDGSFQMNIHELQTIVHHKVPTIIFVTNNQGYHAIRTTQNNLFKAHFIGESKESGISFPDTEKIAYAYGIKFFKIKNPQDLVKFIPSIFRTKGPVICEVVCPRWQDILSVSSMKMPDGRMVSQPIDNMFPFLNDQEMKKIKRSLS